MKSLSMLLSLMAMSGQYEIPSDRPKNNLRPEDIDVTPKKKVIPNGCRVFAINGKEIVAINEKSAHKKYQKQLAGKQ